MVRGVTAGGKRCEGESGTGNTGTLDPVVGVGEGGGTCVRKDARVNFDFSDEFSKE